MKSEGGINGRGVAQTKESSMATNPNDKPNDQPTENPSDTPTQPGQQPQQDRPAR